MKNLDLISKRIAVISIAICGILLCTSLLVFAIGSVTKGYATDNKPAYKNIPATPPVAGEIMMAPWYFNEHYYGILVWNSVSGKSVMYSLGETVYGKTTSLPANPLD